MTLTTPLPVPEPEAISRRARFGAVLRRVRSVRLGPLGGDRIERTLLVAGGVLIPLGTLMILLSWAGAAGTARVYEQIPYLISGGLLGLALIVAGGFAYFGYWLTSLVHESRANGDRMVEALERIEVLLGGTGAGAKSSLAAGNGSPTRTLVATASGTMVHRPDCPVVVNRPNLRPVAVGHPGFEPCKVCQPDG